MHPYLLSSFPLSNMKKCSYNMISSLFIYFFFLFMVGLSLVGCDNNSSLQAQCSQEFTSLTECLNYASGKADEPTSKCCSSIAGTKQSDTVCLCYIIQQTNDGNPAASSLGLQVARLVQLPTECKIANSSLSVSNCPKLLNLSPGSPDYSIFNSTAKATTTTASGSSTGTIKSKGFMHQIHLRGTVAIAAISAIWLSIL